MISPGLYWLSFHPIICWWWWFVSLAKKIKILKINNYSLIMDGMHILIEIDSYFTIYGLI